MSTQRRRALQAVLALVAIPHLVLGLLAFSGLSGPVEGLVERAYGATILLTDQTRHVVRILGAFMIAIGVLAGLAALRPGQSRPIVIGLVVLLLLRVLQRVIFAGEIREAFGVSAGRLWAQSIFFFIIAAALLALSWVKEDKLSRDRATPIGARDEH